MKATEKTFNGLRISGFIALFLLLALSGLCCYLIADTNEDLERNHRHRRTLPVSGLFIGIHGNRAQQCPSNALFRKI